MKAPSSSAVATLAVVVSFATFAAGAVVAVRLVTPGPARLVVEREHTLECGGSGYVVVGGRDWDRSGALSDDELETSAVVCATHGQLQVPFEQDALDGAFDAGGRPRHRLPVLLGFGETSSGPGCSLGGLEVSVGVDRNRDGELAPGEVTETCVLCRRFPESTARPTDLATLVLPD
jgi:hypothetical protein